MNKTSQLTEQLKGQVLFQTSKWSIEIATLQDGRKRLVVVRDQTFTDWVIVYEDKRVAFDYPEIIPAYIIIKTETQPTKGR